MSMQVITEPLATAVVIFFCLLAASLGSVLLYHRMRPLRYQEETTNLVRQVATIFVVMTSLFVGLLLNSARNSFETIDRDMHVYATNMILMNRTLRQFGPETEDARVKLAAYLRRITDPTVPELGPENDPVTERLLNDFGASVRALKPDPVRGDLWHDIQQDLNELLKLRWALVEESEGELPAPLVALPVAWLMMIFASYGYKAPRNIIVAGSFVLAAFLISGAIYLIMDLEQPFSGLIRVSYAPLERALEEIQR
jgi:hypothetical protein